MSYEIIRRESGPDAYPIDQWWAVMAYNDKGDALGVDYHWLSRESAEKAKTVYERGLASHGGVPADTVLAIYDEAQKAGRLLQTYEVILRVTIDPRYYDPPSEWAWAMALGGKPNDSECSIEVTHQYLIPQTGEQ